MSAGELVQVHDELGGGTYEVDPSAIVMVYPGWLDRSAWQTPERVAEQSAVAYGSSYGYELWAPAPNGQPRYLPIRLDAELVRVAPSELMFQDEWMALGAWDVNIGGRTLPVWACVGVPESMRSTAEAAGTKRGVLSSWVPADGRGEHLTKVEAMLGGAAIGRRALSIWSELEDTRRWDVVVEGEGNVTTVVAPDAEAATEAAVSWYASAADLEGEEGDTYELRLLVKPELATRDEAGREAVSTVALLRREEGAWVVAGRKQQ